MHMQMRFLRPTQPELRRKELLTAKLQTYPSGLGVLLGVIREHPRHSGVNAAVLIPVLSSLDTEQM